MCTNRIEKPKKKTTLKKHIFGLGKDFAVANQMLFAANNSLMCTCFEYPVIHLLIHSYEHVLTMFGVCHVNTRCVELHTMKAPSCLSACYWQWRQSNRKVAPVHTHSHTHTHMKSDGERVRKSTVQKIRKKDYKIILLYIEREVSSQPRIAWCKVL